MCKERNKKKKISVRKMKLLKEYVISLKEGCLQR